VSAAIPYVKHHPESPAELKLNKEEQFAAYIRKETSGNFTNDETINGEDQDNYDQSVFSSFSDTELSESDASLHEEDTQTSNSTERKLHPLHEKDMRLLPVNPEREECNQNEEFILDEDKAIVDEDDTNLPEAEMEPIAMSQLNNAGNDENITSKADIFVTKNNVQAVPQYLLYAYRGEELAFFSLYEYVALVDVIPMKGKTTRETSECGNRGAGRLSNGVFLFEANHPLHGKIMNPYNCIPVN
jgi:hypothetical protein